MAVAIVRDTPGMTAEMYDAIMQKLDVASKPISGLILHTVGVFEGGWRAIDVWESKDAWETFMRERFEPAMREAGDTAHEATTGPAPEFMEVYSMIP